MDSKLISNTNTKNYMTIKAKILNIFTNLYKDYAHNHADEVFTEPTIKCWFSTPNGRGSYARYPVIHLTPRKYRGWYTQSNMLSYFVSDSVLINTHDNVWERSYHKLPGKLKNGQRVWGRNMRKKLRKWGLGWVPPTITLPRWLYFGIDNHPLGWKTKWGEYRFENPPRWSIFVFGFSFNITLSSPYVDTVDEWRKHDDDSYWEGILSFQDKYGLKKKECGLVSSSDMVNCLHSAIDDIGWYSDTVYTESEQAAKQAIVDDSKGLQLWEVYEKTKHLGTKRCYIRLRPQYLKDNWKEQFYVKKLELQKKYPDNIWW